MADTIQIMFLGYWDHMDRMKFLLRKFIPHKVYFIKSEEAVRAGKDVEDFRDEMKKELEKELPDWVRKASVEIEVPFFKFEEIFPRMINIMSEEKKKGNEVIVNIHGASLLMAIATTIAAGLTNSKVYWIMPAKWDLVDSGKRKVLKPVGAVDMFEINVPLLPSMPSGPEKSVLDYVEKNSGKVKGKLSTMSEEIGLKNLSANIKKPSSGIVKLSKTITKLRDSGLIETKKIGRKNFEISLTSKGKMMAEISSSLGST